MTSTEKLLGILGRGKENAVDRFCLAEKMDMRDRDMREAVMMARIRDRVPICNDQDGKGYYLPASQEEIRRQRRQILRRGKAIFAQLKTFQDMMGMDGQITLDDLLSEAE